MLAPNVVILMSVKLAMALVGNTLTWEKYMIMAEVQVVLNVETAKEVANVVFANNIRLTGYFYSNWNFNRV